MTHAKSSSRPAGSVEVRRGSDTRPIMRYIVVEGER
jgi:hypothetical protein